MVKKPLQHIYNKAAAEPFKDLRFPSDDLKKALDAASPTKSITDALSDLKAMSKLSQSMVSAPLIHPSTLAAIKMPHIKPIAVQEAETFQEGILEVLNDLQASLADDEELVVYYTNGLEAVRVSNVYMSSTNVAVISGVDGAGNEARVVAHFKAVQFVCKVVKVEPEKPKVTIGFKLD
jgi:hypothetical protein